MAEMRMQAPHQSAGGLDVQAPHAILALLSPIDIGHVKLIHMGDGRMTSLAAIGGIRTARSRRPRGAVVPARPKGYWKEQAPAATFHDRGEQGA